MVSQNDEWKFMSNICVFNFACVCKFDQNNFLVFCVWHYISIKNQNLDLVPSKIMWYCSLYYMVLDVHKKVVRPDDRQAFNMFLLSRYVCVSFTHLVPRYMTICKKKNLRYTFTTVSVDNEYYIFVECWTTMNKNIIMLFSFDKSERLFRHV